MKSYTTKNNKVNPWNSQVRALFQAEEKHQCFMGYQAWRDMSFTPPSPPLSNSLKPFAESKIVFDYLNLFFNGKSILE